MRYSILFAAVLILVSGFIAYFGDMLGRWMGKKRLTLLRMRPRHTAYAVTAVTGMLIAALTLGTLISVNKDFNRLWNEGDRIIAQNKKLSKDNRSLSAQRKSLDTRIKALQGEVDQAEEERLKAVEAQAKAVEAQAKAATAVKLLEKDIAARKLQIETQKNQLATLRKTGETAKAELRSKTAELSVIRLELSRTKEALGQARGLRDKAKTELAAMTKAVEQKETALQQLNAALVDQQTALEKLGRAAMAYERQRDQLLGGDIRLRQGDELYRGTISPRQSLFGIKGDLYSLLDAASARAAQAGAGMGPNGRSIVLPEYIVDENGSSRVPETEWVDQTARSISAGALTSPDTLVRVVCIGNSLVGEQAPVTLVLHYNKIVYRKGQLIASTTMNGRLSEGRVLLAVVGFLQSEVSMAGLKAGIVPVSNPDPRASLGADSRTQVEGLISVVDQVKAQGTRVKVEAYACADVYAAGPLSMTNMRFSVSKAD